MTDDSARLGQSAWTLLAKAREAKRDAARTTSHADAEFYLFAARQYVALARRTNHMSVRSRSVPQRWTPPVLRALEVSS